MESEIVKLMENLSDEFYIESKLIKIIKLEKTCSMCPAQWRAETKNGKFIYIRYRGGFFYVSIGNNAEDCVIEGEILMRYELFGLNDAFKYDGYMSTERMVELTRDILDFSDFEGKFKQMDDED